MGQTRALPDFDVLKDKRTGDERFAAWIELRRLILPEYKREDLGDHGNVDARIACGITDYMDEYTDLEAAQNHIDRVQRRSSCQAILRAEGSDLAPASAAEGDLLVTLSDDYPQDIPIPQFHSFSNPASGEHYVCISEDAIVPARSKVGACSAMHGEIGRQSFDPTNGRANQVFETSISDIVFAPGQETIDFRIGGLKYKVVKSLAASGPRDLHVEGRFLPNGGMRFVVGDGRNGKKPDTGLDVSMTFIHGGGEKGNCDERSITSMDIPLQFNGAAIAAQVTNPRAFTGGGNPESVERARFLAPAAERANDRCVSPADFVSAARKVAGVLDATLARVGMSTLRLYVLAKGGLGVPGNALLGSVKSVVLPASDPTDDFQFRRPNLVYTDLQFLVRTKPHVRDKEAVRQACLKACADFQDHTLRLLGDSTVTPAIEPTTTSLFGNPDNLEDLGNGSLAVSDLQGILEAIDGVDNFDTNRFTRIPQATRTIWSGDAYVSAISLGEAVLEEIWTVFFTSATTFRVYGSVSGQVGNGLLTPNGAPPIVFQDTKGKVSFSVIKGPDGAKAMKPGDTATFRTSRLVGNINLFLGEVAVPGSILVQVP